MSGDALRCLQTQAAGHGAHRSLTWKTPGFLIFLITFIDVVFVWVGVHTPQCAH